MVIKKTKYTSQMYEEVRPSTNFRFRALTVEI